MLDASACLNGRVPTVEEFDCRQEQAGQVKFAEICSAVHARTVLRHLNRQFSHVFFMFTKHDGTITGREIGSSS